VKKDIVIVGAGMAGISAANCLTQAGRTPLIVDKARAPGGRMATRTHGELRFDFGAQYFTARSSEFQKEVDTWLKRSWVQTWEKTFPSENKNHQQEPQTRYTSPFGMRGLLTKWASTLSIQTSAKVVSIQTSGSEYELQLESGEHIQCHHLILTAPLPQSIDLLRLTALADKQELSLISSLEFDPCWALFFRCHELPHRLSQGGFWPDPESGVSWISNNASKDLCSQIALTVHLTSSKSSELGSAWSPKNDHQDWWMKSGRRSLPWLADFLGDKTNLLDTHFWRYSQPRQAGVPGAFLRLKNQNIYLAGDALAGGRAEGAYLSGLRAALSLPESTD